MGKEVAVSAFLQDELRKRNMMSVAAVDAARWLAEARLLKDSATRRGLPLRDMLRAGQITGQRQELNRRWFIDRLDGGRRGVGGIDDLGHPRRAHAPGVDASAAAVASTQVEIAPADRGRGEKSGEGPVSRRGGGGVGDVGEPHRPRRGVR